MTIEFLQSDRMPGLFIDALVTDSDNKLLFLSAWGSEAYVQQTRAALALPYVECPLRVIYPVPVEGKTDRCYPTTVVLGDKERLADVVGRPVGNTLLAHLTQVWIYDKLALTLDRANSQAVLLRRHSVDDAAFNARIWKMVQTLSRTPLHSSWDNLVLAFKSRQWIRESQGFGVDACVIELPEEAVEAYVMDAIHQGRLTLPIIH